MAAPKWASRKNAIAMCDYCGQQYKRKQLKEIIVRMHKTNLQACPTCWDYDHPQNMQGMYPVYDPQAIENPRPDTTYWQAGMTGLQVYTTDGDDHSLLAFGYPSDGSRVVQWGWNPVGLNNPLALSGLEDALEGNGEVGDVTVTIG